MDRQQLTLLVAGVVVAVVVLVAAVALLRVRGRALRDVREAREDVETLRAQVQDLSRRVGTGSRSEESVPREFVITTLPDGTADGTPVARPEERPVSALTAGQFASVAVGESVVRLLSLGYGVRRALSAENRNRIRFEMRQEVKRQRRQRRQDLRAAKRALRQSGGERSDLTSDAA